jgi:hypothetical protein
MILGKAFYNRGHYIKIATTARSKKAYYIDWELRKTDTYREWDTEEELCGRFGLDPEKTHFRMWNPLKPLSNVIYNMDKPLFKESTVALERKLKNVTIDKIIPAIRPKSIVYPFDIDGVFEPADRNNIEQWAYSAEAVDWRVDEIVKTAIAEVAGIDTMQMAWLDIHFEIWRRMKGAVSDQCNLKSRGQYHMTEHSLFCALAAYVSSFFDLSGSRFYNRGARTSIPYEALVAMWNRGIVITYDGCVWSAHTKTGCKRINDIELRPSTERLFT